MILPSSVKEKIPFLWFYFTLFIRLTMLYVKCEPENPHVHVADLYVEINHN